MHRNNHLGTRIGAGSRGFALATGLAAIMVLGGSPAHADLRDDIGRCAALTDQTERLACFDTVAAELANVHNAAAGAAITALQREFRFDPGLMTGPLEFQINVSGNQVVSRETTAAREVEALLRRVQKIIGGTDDWRASVTVHGGQVTLSRGRPYTAAELLAQARTGMTRTGLPKDRYSVDIGPDAQPVLWDDGRVRSANENIEIVIGFGEAATR
ncbi:MAG: hypothetical protein HOL07_16225 [Rhodospirillaceae bacterium]|jgi:hypothetical protein|nr:hypothetical protein [Rhodospirillaceae bacterium]MBT4771925.1 hypothetical protein [Rhodospirillaceae bacterium]MBT5359890.1 hypothetical protein [Rhodospirillaceae bacterium]MBT5768172.1 hypothetical protein [Rhodospirillaceae bacterium]MBT6310708.1 hypothetical protein [Rhodospirillaceae bacterium]